MRSDLETLVNSESWKDVRQGLERRLSNLGRHIIMDEYDDLSKIEADKAVYRELKRLYDHPLEYLWPEEEKKEKKNGGG